MSSSPTRTLPPASTAMATNGSSMRPMEKAENTAPGGSLCTSASSVGVVRRAVGDAQAELDQRRVVDQPVAQELLDEDQVPGVEDLELRPHAELLHVRRHRAQHRGAC